MLQLGKLVAERFVTIALAQVYNGPGLQAGFEQARAIVGTSPNLRAIILRALVIVLSFMALAAAIAIIIAGIFLVAGGATDNSKEKAKKLILYTVIGLAIILLARLAVQFVIGVFNA